MRKSIKVVAITLRDGKASFSNRYVKTPGLRAELAADRTLYGSNINGGPPHLAKPPAPPVKNPVNTNVTVFGDRLLVFAEIDRPIELRRDTLDTVGFYDFGGIEGADKHCQALAAKAGAGAKTWRAYLSVQASGSAKAVNARDRIGKGPWVNTAGVQIASSVADLRKTRAVIADGQLHEVSVLLAGPVRRR